MISLLVPLLAFELSSVAIPTIVVSGSKSSSYQPDSKQMAALEAKDYTALEPEWIAIETTTYIILIHKPSTGLMTIDSRTRLFERIGSKLSEGSLDYNYKETIPVEETDQNALFHTLYQPIANNSIDSMSQIAIAPRISFILEGENLQKGSLEHSTYLRHSLLPPNLPISEWLKKSTNTAGHAIPTELTFSSSGLLKSTDDLRERMLIASNAFWAIFDQAKQKYNKAGERVQKELLFSVFSDAPTAFFDSPFPVSRLTDFPQVASKMSEFGLVTNGDRSAFSNATVTKTRITLFATAAFELAGKGTQTVRVEIPLRIP